MKSLYPFTQAGFIAVTFVYFGLFFAMLSSAIKRTSMASEKQNRVIRNLVIGFIIWIAATGALASIDFFSNFQEVPPRFAILIVIPLVAILWLTATRTAREILSHIPPHTIVYLQTFRIFVEILLWMLFIDDIIPIQMTFEGRNFDILVGITSIVIGFLLQRQKISRSLLIGWNVVSLLILLNIVSIAMLSTPSPFRVFMNEPANTIVTQFPVVWLPAALVPLAYLLHILSIRRSSIRS